MIAGMLVLCAGCGDPPASGAVDEVVVVTAGEVWAALEEGIVAALEPRTFTVRHEPIFEVAYLEPADVPGSRLRRARQVLLIGSAREPLIAEALGDRHEASGRPAVLQVRDRWARNQVVTVALLPESAEPRALEPLLPTIRDLLVRQLENAIRVRMTLMPTNEWLAERLRREGGFTLRVPYAYDFERPEPGVFVFRHAESGAGPVVRTITVESRARAAVDWTAEAASVWRAELAARLNRPPHVTDTLASAVRGRVAGRPIVQVQGVWSNPPGEWPSAGPFIARMVRCPERVFLIDAWVYAPADEKYEDLYRLDMTLDTFRCAVEGGRSAEERTGLSRDPPLQRVRALASRHAPVRQRTKQTRQPRQGRATDRWRALRLSRARRSPARQNGVAAGPRRWSGIRDTGGRRRRAVRGCGTPAATYHRADV